MERTFQETDVKPLTNLSGIADNSPKKKILITSYAYELRRTCHTSEKSKSRKSADHEEIYHEKWKTRKSDVTLILFFKSVWKNKILYKI